jgi:flagellar biosynthesis/type III secretory pathway protein FliH
MTHAPIIAVRVPADKADAFLRQTCREAEEQQSAATAFDLRQAELAAAETTIRELLAQIDERIEHEAQEVADRTSRKLRQNGEAEAVAAALAQVSAIAADYADLEHWLSDLLIAGVSAVLDELEPDERWSRAISRALRDVSQRWQVSLLCHPDDHADMVRAIEGADLSNALSEVLADPSVAKGPVYLKGNSTQVEIDLGAQIEALKDVLSASLQTADAERTEA